MDEPKIIILISGKRKCGKDYISEKLHGMIGPEKCTIVRISEPIKSHYAKQNNLDLKELMSDNPYKEKYRQAMIIWSDEVRKEDPGFFCKAACENARRTSLWIVSDIRRKTDIQWFKSTYNEKILTVRISADVATREKRKWVFTTGVDDVASECDLDDYNEWDLKIANNNNEEFEHGIQLIFSKVKDAL